MGSATSKTRDELTTQIFQSQAAFNISLTKLNDDLLTLLDDMVNRGYILKTEDSYVVNDKICDRLIYYQVGQFVHNTDPIIVNKIAYRIGLKSDLKNTGSAMPEKKLEEMCDKLKKYVTLKLKLVLQIHVAFKSCEKVKDILNTDLTSLEKNRSSYIKCLEDRKSTLLITQNAASVQYSKFQTSYNKLISILQKLYTVNTQNELEVYDKQVKELVRDLNQACTNLSTVYKCPE